VVTLVHDTRIVPDLRAQSPPVKEPFVAHASFDMPQVQQHKRPGYVPSDDAQLFHRYRTLAAKRSSVLDAFFIGQMEDSALFKEVKSRFRALALIIHPDHWEQGSAHQRQAGRSMRVLARAMEIVEAELKSEQAIDDCVTDRNFRVARSVLFTQDETIAEQHVRQIEEEEREREERRICAEEARRDATRCEQKARERAEKRAQKEEDAC